ncbi:MAG: hypothetical protein N3G76_02665 [Candidatus Micrarchaeota archaeon]|nr:hypothetical protein [Candidatus Micrarchaeota archaeon]
MKLKILAALLLVSLALSFSAQQIGAYDLGNPATWMGIAVLIVIIHLTLVSLAYMVSGIFKDEELKAWCKNEVVQAIYSLVIVSSIGAALVLVDSTVKVFFVGVINPAAQCTDDECRHTLRTDLVFDPSKNRWKESGEGLYISVEGDEPVCKWLGKGQAPPCDPKFLMARAYLGITYEKLSSLLGNMMYSYAALSAVDSMGFSNSFFILNRQFGITFGSGYPTHSVLLTSISHMVGFTEKMMMLIKFQESILKYFEFGLAGALIVLGIFLRSIWVFRKAGGLFLAMGIGMMFVLPALYILGWYTIDIKPIQEAGISRKGGEGVAGGSAPSGVSGFFEQIGNLMEMLAAQGGGGASELISAYAILASLLAFVGLRGVELANPITTVPAAIKMGLDVTMVLAIITTLAALASSPIKNADQLYTDYENGKIGYFDMLSRYALVAVAIPIMNFYIMFSFIRGLSPLLGGEHDIPGLSRLL